MVKAVRPPQGAATAASGPAGARDDAPARTSTVSAALLLRSPGVLWRVARCGFVVVAAGVLVTGDLGSADGPAGTGTASAQLERPVLSGISVRAVEVQQGAAVARAESLALADAALRAGAAAQSLTRTPPADDAGTSDDGTSDDDTPGDAEPSGAGSGLAADHGAIPGLPADRVAALQALESAAQEATADGLEPLRPVTDAEDADELWGITTDEDADGDADPADGTRPAADLPSDADGDADPHVLVPADEPADDATAPGDVAPLEDALDESPADPSDDPLGYPTDDPTVDGAPDDGLADPLAGTSVAPGTEELDAAVAHLEALVRQARGDAGQPSDGGVPADVFRTPSSSPVTASALAGPVPLMATSELALTTALEEAAGAVFALSLRAEGATEAAARAEVVARQEAVSSVVTSAQATLAAADALPTLEPLSPAELDERASAGGTTSAGQGRAPAARQRAVASAAAPRAGASATVADLAARWDNGLLPTDSLCRVEFDPDHLLQCDAAEALGDLNVAYRAHFGADLRLTDSYRTLAGQIAVKAAKPTLAATPGTSNHGWGLAIDVAGAGAVGQFDTPVYLWLKANAEDFGWHHPRAMEPGGSAPQEPWHWEYKTR